MGYWLLWVKMIWLKNMVDSMLMYEDDSKHGKFIWFVPSHPACVW